MFFLLIIFLPVFGVYTWWTGLDGVIVKSSLEGKIMSNGSGLSDVSITVDGKYKGKSNKDGGYKIGGIRNGKARIKLEKNGYDTIDKGYYVGRYKNYKDFEMTEMPKGRIVGKLDLNAPYDISQVAIKLDNDLVKVNNDGSFESEEIYRGIYNLIISSPEFVDVVYENYELKSGNNDLGKINLTPAGDIQAIVKDWVNDQPLEGVTVKEIENSSVISGQLLIRDYTEINANVKLDLTKAGYLPFTVTKKVVMGKNDFGNVSLFREEKVFYIDSSSRNLIVENMDGTERMDAVDGDLKVSSFFVTQDKNKILFTTEEENPKIYSVTFKDSSPKLINNYAGTTYEKVFINLAGGKVVGLAKDSNDSYTMSIEELNGDNSKVIYTGSESVSSAVISNDGSSVFYSLDTGSTPGVYKYSDKYSTTRRVVNKSGVGILGTSDDGLYCVLTWDSKTYMVNSNNFRQTGISSSIASDAFFVNGKIAVTEGSTLSMKNIDGKTLVSAKAKGAILNMWRQNLDNIMYLLDSEGVKVFDINVLTLKLIPVI